VSLPNAEAICPYCRAGFEPDEEITACPACGTLHHADCFTENGGCTIFGCTAAPADEPSISVTRTDFHPPPTPIRPSAGTSLYGLRDQAEPQEVVAPPPPPPLTFGSAPPPPMQAGAWGAGTPGPQPFEYGYGAYVRPKSRVAFVLLAVFLGSFGAHNFYAGYNKKAIMQLLLTVGTCFWASLITWIWAIVEACTVTMDDDGVLLS